MKVANCPNDINFWGAQYASGRRFTYKSGHIPTPRKGLASCLPSRNDRPTDRPQVAPCLPGGCRPDRCRRVRADERHDRTPAGGRLLYFVVVVAPPPCSLDDEPASLGRPSAPTKDGPLSHTDFSARYPERQQQQGRPLRRRLRLVLVVVVRVQEEGGETAPPSHTDFSARYPERQTARAGWWSRHRLAVGAGSALRIGSGRRSSARISLSGAGFVRTSIRHARPADAVALVRGYCRRPSWSVSSPTLQLYQTKKGSR
jgi:hypothetical protein